MINWLSGAFSGAMLLYVWFMSTHNCYFTQSGVGLICSTHSFNLDWLLKGWM